MEHPLDLRRPRLDFSRGALVWLFLLIIFSLGLYIHYTQTQVDAWDPMAYWYAGQRIASGHGPTFCHPFNESIGPYFTLSGFNVRTSPGPCLKLNYPPGFPLALAAAQWVTGRTDAALYVPALLGALGLVVTAGLGTVLFDRWTGLLGALLSGFMPVYLLNSTSLWSDLPGAVVTMGGITLYLWVIKRAMGKTRAHLVATLAAVLVIWGVFFRYTNVLFLLPLALYVLVTERRHAFGRSHHWVFAGVLFIGIVGVLLFNRSYFGGYLTTGYSPRHGWYTWSAFSLRYAWGSSPVGSKSLLAVINTLGDNLGWLAVPGLIGLVGMPRPKAVLIGVLILSFTFLYSVYAFPAQGVNARFLSVILPSLGVAVAWGLGFGVRRWGWHDRKAWLWMTAGGVLVVVSLIFPLPGRLEALKNRNAAAARQVQLVRTLVEDSEPDAVFLAYNWNDLILYQGKRLTFFYRRIPLWDAAMNTWRWDQFEPRIVEVVTRLLDRGIPVYYVQDSDPPFGNSLDILERHFSLSLCAGTDLPVHRVSRNSGGQ